MTFLIHQSHWLLADPGRDWNADHDSGSQWHALVRERELFRVSDDRVAEKSSCIKR